MPTSKHWVNPNTIPYASPSLKMLYSVTTVPQYWTPGMGAYHFKLSLFVFDEVAENADCTYQSKLSLFYLIDYVVMLPASGIFPRRCRRRGGSRGRRHAWRAAFRAD